MSLLKEEEERSRKQGAEWRAFKVAEHVVST